MKMVSNIQWGWRVQCAHEDCGEHLEVWGSPKGPREDPHIPPLLGDTYSRKGAYEGWYFYSFPVARQRIYRAFCPTHAPQVFGWRENLNDWFDARQEKAQEQSRGLLDRLQEWGRSLFNKKMGDRMRVWEAQNPRPVPPWEQTDG